MGEAKQRSKRIDALRALQPFCVYCGGTAAGETIDHMPPITLFDLRHRPKGLEFLACSRCNSETRKADQVVGLLSRLYPDPVDSVRSEEFKRLLKEVSNNHPGLLEEIAPGPLQFEQAARVIDKMPDGAGTLKANGPLLSNAMSVFCRKLGLAMHFERTGKIVPPSGAIYFRWFSNFEFFTGAVPDEYVRFCGPPTTLRQGRFSVEDQFQVASAYSPDGEMSAHFAVFRISFAVAAVAALDANRLKDAPAGNVGRPGF